MSIRVFTDQQFADGTTIDGNRLEDALQSLEARVNKVPDGDLKNRWMQTQIVLGFSPPTAHDLTGSSYNWGQRPWMPKLNTVPSITGDTGEMNNQNRMKGNSEASFQWTTSIQLTRPAVIHSYDLIFAHDTVASHPFAPGDASNQTNIGIVISVDNPWRPEDRTQNDVALHKKDFGTTSQQANTGAIAPSFDMLPSYAGSAGLNAVAVTGRDLNIPLAPGTRLRFSVTIPSGGTTYWGDS
jgi:hypothetical protein